MYVNDITYVTLQPNHDKVNNNPKVMICHNMWTVCHQALFETLYKMVLMYYCKVANHGALYIQNWN